MNKGCFSPDLVIKSSKSDVTVISGYASVFGIVDSHNDIVMKGAFKSVKVDNVKLLWQHDIYKPIGAVTFLSEDQYGLKFEYSRPVGLLQF